MHRQAAKLSVRPSSSDRISRSQGRLATSRLPTPANCRHPKRLLERRTVACAVRTLPMLRPPFQGPSSAGKQRLQRTGEGDASWAVRHPNKVGNDSKVGKIHLNVALSSAKASGKASSPVEPQSSKDIIFSSCGLIGQNDPIQVSMSMSPICEGS